MKHIKLTFLSLMASVLLSNCATLIHGGRQDLTIRHESASQATISNSKGVQVGEGNIPFVVRVKRSAGFLKKERYTVQYIFPDQHREVQQLETVVDGWILGNIIYGGFTGGFVDCATGAIFRIEQP